MYARARNKYPLRDQTPKLCPLDLSGVPMNLAPIPSDTPRTSSRFKGVYKYGEIWHTQIPIEGNPVNLGYFDSEEEAGIMYARACYKYLSSPAAMPHRLQQPEATIPTSASVDYTMKPVQQVAIEGDKVGINMEVVQSHDRPHPTTTAPPRSMGMTTGSVSLASVSGPSSSVGVASSLPDARGHAMIPRASYQAISTPAVSATMRTGVAQAPAGQASVSVLPGSLQQPLHSISTTISGQMPQSSASHMMNMVPIISTQAIPGAAMSNGLPPGAGQPPRAPQSNVAAVASTIPAAMQGRPTALPTSVAMMQKPSFVQGGAGLNLTNPMAMPMVANMGLARGVPGNPMAAMTTVPLAPTGWYYEPCPFHTIHMQPILTCSLPRVQACFSAWNGRHTSSDATDDDGQFLRICARCAVGFAGGSIACFASRDFRSNAVWKTATAWW